MAPLAGKSSCTGLRAVLKLIPGQERQRLSSLSSALWMQREQSSTGTLGPLGGTTAAW